MSSREPTVAPVSASAASAAFEVGSLRVSRRAVAVGLVIAVTLAIAFLPPLAALWLVFGSGLVALVLARPIAGLYLLPFAVAFGSTVDATIHGVNIGPTDLLVGTLALACVWRVSVALRDGRDRHTGETGRGRDKSRPYSEGSPAVTGASSQGIAPALASLWASLPDRLRAAWRRDRMQVALGTALLAYLAVVVLSLVVATDHISTLKEILKWSEVAVVVACAAYLLSNVPRSFRAGTTSLARVRLLAWAVMLAATLEAVLALAQWAASDGARVVGTFDQPNPLAGYLNFALPLAVALVLFSPDVRERWMAAAAGELLAGGEIVARSRGATLGIIVAVLVIAVIGWQRERLAAWVVGLGVPLAALAWVVHVIPLSLQQRLLDEVRLDDATLCYHVNDANFSTMERLAHWAAGLRMFAAHPLLGVGAGNFNAAYARYNTWCWPAALGHAHNYYINVAAETGVLGLVTFLALGGVALALGWRATRMNPANLAAPTGSVAPSVAAAPPAAPTVATTSSPRAPDAASSSPSSSRSSPGAPSRASIQERALARALALGFLGTLVALAVHNLTDDLFVHAMELQFALAVAALLRLRVLPRGGA